MESVDKEVPLFDTSDPGPWKAPDHLDLAENDVLLVDVTQVVFRKVLEASDWWEKEKLLSESLDVPLTDRGDPRDLKEAELPLGTLTPTARARDTLTDVSKAPRSRRQGTHRGPDAVPVLDFDDSRLLKALTCPGRRGVV